MHKVSLNLQIIFKQITDGLIGGDAGGEKAPHSFAPSAFGLATVASIVMAQSRFHWLPPLGWLAAGLPDCLPHCRPPRPPARFSPVAIVETCVIRGPGRSAAIGRRRADSPWTGARGSTSYMLRGVEARQMVEKHKEVKCNLFTNIR